MVERAVNTEVEDERLPRSSPHREHLWEMLRATVTGRAARQVGFVSYRWQNDGAAAARLAARLEEWLGPDGVYFDVDHSPPGDDFVVDYLERIKRVECVFVVIGRTWVAVTREGQRVPRLFEEDDHVRRELIAALAAATKVVPILVDGAVEPKADVLPPELAALASKSSFELRHETFEHDVDGMARKLFGYRRTFVERRRIALAAFATLLLGSLLLVGIFAASQAADRESLLVMPGESVLQVAVLPLAGAGNLSSEIGIAEANKIAEGLRASVDGPISVTIWGPEDLGTETAVQEAETAERIADEIGADVVLFGRITSKPGVTSVSVSAVLSPSSFAASTGIDTGTFPVLETSEEIGLSTNPRLLDRLLSDVTVGAASVTELLQGLALYADRDYDEAISDFEQIAVALEGTEDADHLRSTALLFAGNANLRAWAAGSRDGLSERTYLTAAGRSYREALQVRDGFDRALLGAADVQFFEGSLGGRCGGDSNGNAIGQTIETYGRIYDNASVDGDSPDLAEIRMKALLGMARSRYCLWLAGMEDQSAQASAELTQVIEDYEDRERLSDRDRGRQRAANAYGLRGVIYIGVGDDEAAASDLYFAACLADADNELVWKPFLERAFAAIEGVPDLDECPEGRVGWE